MFTNEDWQSIIFDFYKNIFRKPTREETRHYKIYKAAFRDFTKSGWIPPYMAQFKLSIPDIVHLSKLPSKQLDDFIYNKFTEKHYKNCKVLIKIIKTYNFPNPRFLSGAIILYNKKEYTSCCVLLFTLIEQLIRNTVPKGNSTNSNDNIPPKVKLFLDKTLNPKPVLGYPSQPQHYLMKAALDNVLEKYFKKANDFQNEPEEINRNYLAHGMAKREYTHRDCMKLFVVIHFLICCILTKEQPKND